MKQNVTADDKHLKKVPTIQKFSSTKSMSSEATTDTTQTKITHTRTFSRLSQSHEESYREMDSTFNDSEHRRNVGRLVKTHHRRTSTRISTATSFNFPFKIPTNVVLPHFYDDDDKNKLHDLEIKSKGVECLLCCLRFEDNIKLQAHLNVYIHEQAYDPTFIRKNLKEIELACRLCGGTILFYLLNTHKCYLEVIELYSEKFNWINNVYTPLVCILCKKVKIFNCQAVLQIHLITTHGPNKHPYGCSICGSKFKTTDTKLHETHAIDFHSGELNLYHKLHEIELLERKNKKETESFRYTCLFNSLHSKGNQKVVCSEIITDLFKLTIHTLCFHSYCFPKKIGGKMQKESDMLTCHSCLKEVNNGEELENHITWEHTGSVLLKRDYLIKRGMLNFLLPVDITCLVCLHVFPGILELQIHVLVNHTAIDHGHCGLCNYYLMSMYYSNKEEQQEKNELEDYTLAWKRINYHESLHVQQFLEYVKTKYFQKSLIKQPQLFQTLDEFLSYVHSKYVEEEGPLLTKNQYKSFVELGEINYENQIEMELKYAD